MDRFKLNTKALLGMATRTVDEDHEMRHTCVKALRQAVAQYEAAVSKFVASVSVLPDSLLNVEEAYRSVIANEKQVLVFDGVKEITGHLEELGLAILPDFVETFAPMVTSAFLALKGDCDACERIHNERAKAVDLYDYYRDVVEKKEVQYAAKGKSLDDSKHYKEDLSKCDAAKNEYLGRHAEYNKTHDELMRKKSELTALSVKVFVYGLSDLLEKLQNTVSRMRGIADNISANLTLYEEGGTPVSHDVPLHIDAPKKVQNEELGEAENAGAAEGEEPSNELSPTAK